jgi:hypothetical protein
MILEVNCHGRKRKTKIGNTIIPRLRPVWAEAEHRDPENREKGRKGATVVRVCACDPAATALSLSLSLSLWPGETAYKNVSGGSGGGQSSARMTTTRRSKRTSNQGRRVAPADGEVTGDDAGFRDADAGRDGCVNCESSKGAKGAKGEKDEKRQRRQLRSRQRLRGGRP